MKDAGGFVVVVTVRVRGVDGSGSAPTEPEPPVCVQAASRYATDTSRSRRIGPSCTRLTSGPWR